MLKHIITITVACLHNTGKILAFQARAGALLYSVGKDGLKWTYKKGFGWKKSLANSRIFICVFFKFAELIYPMFFLILTYTLTFLVHDETCPLLQFSNWVFSLNERSIHVLYFYSMQCIFALPGWSHACIWENKRASHLGLIFYWDDGDLSVRERKVTKERNVEILFKNYVNTQ